MTSPGARPLNEWLPQWMDSLAQGKRVYPEDSRAMRVVSPLKSLCNSRLVKRGLTKIYNAAVKNKVVEVEDKTRRFLAGAIMSWLGGDPLGSPDPKDPSIRRRELSKLAKAAHKFADSISPETISLLIPQGFERDWFLKPREYDPRNIFKPDNPEDVWWDDYDGGKYETPLPCSLSRVVYQFACALDAQVKWLSSQPVHRSTRLNDYVDSLILQCALCFKRVDSAFIATIGCEISGRSISPSMVAKRVALHRKALSSTPTPVDSPAGELLSVIRK